MRWGHYAAPINSGRCCDECNALVIMSRFVIVTPNMQQTTRCSDMTAFFYLGRLIEFDRTVKLFTNSVQKQTEDYISGRFG
jgi:phosphate transport system ATP-binding protein